MNNTWKNYFENTKNNPPRELLQKALPFVQKRDFALDLGSGALNDVMYLLKEEFGYVTALDKTAVAKEIADTLPKNRFEYIISTFEDFGFVQEKYDLINAQYSLPFMDPEKFEDVFEKIIDSLVPKGIITGQFFGDRDEWAEEKNMTFHRKEDVQNLLAGLETLHFEECERDAVLASGKPKHWHFFDFIARK